jgi:hypothetical protein
VLVDQYRVAVRVHKHEMSRSRGGPVALSSASLSSCTPWAFSRRCSSRTSVGGGGVERFPFDYEPGPKASLLSVIRLRTLPF